MTVIRQDESSVREKSGNINNEEQEKTETTMRIGTPVAEREITVLINGTGEYKKTKIIIGAPFWPTKDGPACCNIDWGWLANKQDGPCYLIPRVYGDCPSDALRCAIDICSHLEILRDRYDFFLPSGEPLFQGESIFAIVEKEKEELNDIRKRLKRVENILKS